jgi:transposase
MSEFGVILPLRSVTVRKQAATAAEALPELARRVVSDLLEQMRSLDQRIEGYDREIEAQARLSEPARRLMKIRGIGATTALAIVATVGNAREFKNGRQFAAWIGLVPGQYSTGGRPRLGHISKRAMRTFETCSCKERVPCSRAPVRTRTTCRAGSLRCYRVGATTARW